MVHFGFFRRTHPASIHPFDTAEDRRFTATLAPQHRPMDVPGRLRVGLPCSTRGLRYTPCHAQITCYTARIVCERLWVTGTRGSFTRAAELYNRMQPAPRPRRSLAAVG